MPRVVLDPNVLVSALIATGGASAQLLVQLRDGAFESVASPKSLAELDEVLRREKFRRYVTIDEVEAYVELVRTASIVVDDPPRAAGPRSVDPDDQYLIELATATRVDALVSGDPHLLDLRNELPVRSPREFLDSLG